MNIYCATCDRVNGKQAQFCGSCGQPLAVVGSALEKYSFSLWLIVMMSSSFFLPMTLYALVTGHEYITVHAYNIMMNEASLRDVVLLAVVLITYCVLTAFLCRQFASRNWTRLYRYVHVACALAGIGISSYWLVQTVRALLAHTPLAEHAVLTLASATQTTTLAYATISYYSVLILFYIMVLFLCVKKRPTT